MDYEAGHKLDKYEVEKKLGEGGMAVVYKVRHETLKTPFALKILKISHPQIQERMIREGQVQAQLRHPNVVAVNDVITVEGNPGLVMEFIEGMAMDEWIDENNMSMEMAEEFFLQILDALEEAHSKSIIHRDLKPSNVMLESKRGKLIPKVCDFGLAKAMEEDDKGFTKTGVTMGTPAYMAPEQVRNAKTVDQRADIFSLGAIFFEMVTGQQAFQGTDTLDLLNAVANKPHTPPERIVEGLPSRYAAAINGALEKDPNKRIPDCEVFRKVLLGEMEFSTKSKNTAQTMFDLDLFGDEDFLDNVDNSQTELIKKNQNPNQTQPQMGVSSFQNTTLSPEQIQANSNPGLNSSMMQTQINQTMSPEMMGQMQHSHNSMPGVNQSMYPNQTMGPQTVYMQPQDSGTNKIIIVLLLVIIGFGGYYLSVSQEKADDTPQLTAEEQQRRDEEAKKATEAEIAAKVQAELDKKEQEQKIAELEKQLAEKEQKAQKTSSSTKKPTKNTVSKNATPPTDTTPQNQTQKTIQETKTPKEPKTIGTTSEGTVVVTGANKIKLFKINNKQNYSPGKVPAGQYELQVDFGVGMGYQKMDTFTLSSGGVIQYKCDDSFMECKKQ